MRGLIKAGIWDLVNFCWKDALAFEPCEETWRKAPEDCPSLTDLVPKMVVGRNDQNPEEVGVHVGSEDEMDADSIS